MMSNQRSIAYDISLALLLLDIIGMAINIFFPYTTEVLPLYFMVSIFF
jgi:hypothetical protein